MNFTSVSYTFKVDSMEEFQKNLVELQEKHKDMIQSNVTYRRNVKKYGNSPAEDVYEDKYTGSVVFRDVTDMSSKTHAIA